MPKAYMIFTERVHDAELMKEYSKAATAAFGGGSTAKVLAVTREPIALEGEWSATQTVLLEFESEEAARAWYGSDGYQAAAAIRQRAADTDVVILPGL